MFESSRERVRNRRTVKESEKKRPQKLRGAQRNTTERKRCEERRERGERGRDIEPLSN